MPQVIHEKGRIYRLDTGFGYPCLSTVLISELLSCSSLKNFSDYTLDYQTVGRCSCPDYTAGTVGEKSILDIVPEFYAEPLTGQNLPRIVKKVCSATDLRELTVRHHMGQNILLDVLTLNEDRTLDSITFIKVGNSYVPSPLHDYCGLSTNPALIGRNDTPRTIANSFRPKYLGNSFSDLYELFTDTPFIGIDYEKFLSKLGYIEENKDRLIPYGQEFYDLKKEILLYQLEKYKYEIWHEL